MGSEERFDVIVVGAGASGLGVAFMLAKYGFNVLVIERGERVGAKNVYGGRIYSYVFERTISDFRNEAPIERWVRKERFSLMDDSDTLTFELSMGNNEHRNSFTTYLSSFLRWLSKKAEENGALILTGVKVDKLIMDGNKVVGVLAGGDRFMADVVVDAEGVNPMLIKDIRGDWKPHEVSVGVKEVIRLPKGVIEERLGLNEDEGIAHLFIGYPTKYLPGGGFLYTNKESVTLGVVVRLSDAIKGKLPIYELVEDFRQHPYIRNIVKEGSVIEYSAHLVPETPSINLSQLYGDGLLIVGDAAGFVLNTGFTVRGVDFAFWSGVLAAEAIKKAHDEGRYTRDALSYYEALLRESFIIKELQAYSKVQNLINNAMIYNNYVKSIISTFKDIYTMDDKPKKLMATLIENLHEHDLTLVDMLKDLLIALISL